MQACGFGLYTLEKLGLSYAVLEVLIYSNISPRSYPTRRSSLLSNRTKTIAILVCFELGKSGDPFGAWLILERS